MHQGCRVGARDADDRVIPVQFSFPPIPQPFSKLLPLTPFSDTAALEKHPNLTECGCNISLEPTSIYIRMPLMLLVRANVHRLTARPIAIANQAFFPAGTDENWIPLWAFKLLSVPPFMVSGIWALSKHCHITGDAAKKCPMTCQWPVPGWQKLLTDLAVSHKATFLPHSNNAFHLEH